jgi:hypothetical protein
MATRHSEPLSLRLLLRLQRLQRLRRLRRLRRTATCSPKEKGVAAAAEVKAKAKAPGAASGG